MAKKQQGTRVQGKIEKWQDDKGFGFIASEEDSIFFHISEYQSAASNKSTQRPKLGERVSFVIGKDKQGRLQAKKVISLTDSCKYSTPKASRQKQAPSHQDRFKADQSNRLFIALGFYVLLIILAVMGKIIWLVVGWYVAIGVLTFLAYAKDKSAAQRGQWRTPESTLHILSLIGGWAGAMLAQTYLRHKSKKIEFRTVYYLTVIINLAGLLYLLSGGKITM
ncbi:DUF1294 domain-containing protein [Psychrobacter sp. I-STPA10]|uniref:DUF1294 domain-containing protein n=1 Tax=Psychrobacter sp. I-STPA10 TaxID=2585769 RepID=UPI001E28C8E6|nr:DUF1294 domain-containing protein [Psychrobacter sp. I-STPA10]